MSRTPIEEFKTVNYHTPLCLLSDTRKLEEEFQEILDALILTNISLSYIQSGKPGKLYLNNIEVIEKATGENGRI